jgi:hypothetical protein
MQEPAMSEHTPESGSPTLPGTPNSTVLQSLSVDVLASEITTLAASIAIATHRLLHLLAELDRRAPWSGWGLLGGAHWLNWKCGIALGPAREKLRVARALQDLPRIDAAFATGEISYSKVRAMTRVATVQNEEVLLNVARHGTAAHVERLVSGYRRARRLESARQSYIERSLEWSFDEDGSIVIRAQLPAEQGALVLRALHASVAELRKERTGQDVAARVSAETSPAVTPMEPEPIAAARADALCHLAEQFLANPSVPSRQAERYQVVINVDRLHDEASIADDERDCSIEGGQSIARETARRIACDAAVVRVQTDGDGNVLDIGRRSRSVPPAIRRALERRDGGCRFPGCLNHRFVDAHHILHWADGGATCLDNLVLLCRHHHRLLHEFGFRLEMRDDGEPFFFAPDRRLIPAVPDVPRSVSTVAAIVADGGIRVSAETCVPRWCGERMDLHLAVSGLIEATDRTPPQAEISLLRSHDATAHPTRHCPLPRDGSPSGQQPIGHAPRGVLGLLVAEPGQLGHGWSIPSLFESPKLRTPCVAACAVRASLPILHRRAPCSAARGACRCRRRSKCASSRRALPQPARA